MEAKIGGKVHHFYGPAVSDLKAVGKRSMEWDLNDWKWDGDLFTAAPLNSLPSDCRSRQFLPVGSEIPTNTRVSNSFLSGSDEMVVGSDKGKRELEKRRRGVDGEDEELTDEAGSLNLKLGGQVYPVTEGDADKWEGKSGKKAKIVRPSSNRAVCQVEDCRADLSNAKDYHRRHKVCDVHSKATSALVGNVMQRFCQQCSRFHALQEFDEGKRSCRRRLAGHNRRRRKTHPESIESGTPANDEQSNNYLLISLLRILSNIHSNNSSDPTKDQDLLSHLLRSLAGLSGIVNERNLTGLLPGSQDLQNAGTSDGIPAKDTSRTIRQCATVPASELAETRLLGDDDQSGILRNPSPSQSTLLLPPKESILTKANSLSTTVGKTKMNYIDLNSAYNDSQDFMENLQRSDGPIHIGKASPGCPLWVYEDPHKSSPPQASGNSGSTSTQSPSSSSGEAQSRTDRIVFKLFGKDPSDFPLALRKQILDWLSHSPTDIESYIRPGCVILTVYLRMDKSTWEELCYDLSSSLRRLLDAYTDSFWKTGWIYARVRDRVAFVYDGRIVLDTPLLQKNQRSCRIVNIKPIAVCAPGEVEFSVKGVNLSQPTTRLLCALEGNYLAQERADVIGGADLFIEHAEIQTLSFTCIIPEVTGRGFVEVEDHGLSSSFFPFIVVEKDVCSEISTLESIIEAAETVDGLQEDNQNLEARNQALDFIHEMGWLLHRNQLKFRLGQQEPNLDTFPFQRFRWLIEFSVEHDWCAVVKMLLKVLFSNLINEEKHSSIEAALLDIGLLHRAVRRNCRSMVEVLLRYHPDGDLNKLRPNDVHYLFRPDVNGPGGLTPLHIAAGRDGSEHVLDALTDDPGLVGVEVWRSARDSRGLTPNDYACLRGHYSYINLVQKKISKKSGSQHVVLEIPDSHLESSMKQKLVDENKSRKVSSLGTEMTLVKSSHVHCSQCEEKLAHGRTRTSLAIYRPAMLSMVAIAAICVCVALLFKSSPEVDYVYSPFRWEYLEYGSS